MSEENKAGEPLPPRVEALGQYIRDLSFENIAVQSGLNPEGPPKVQVEVNLGANTRSQPNEYEVIVKLTIKADTQADEPIFILELDHGSVFRIENVPEDQLHPFLMIECPRIVFPFLRRIVHDITRDGGYPPLNLENIDWLSLYRNEMARQQAMAGNAQPQGQPN